MKIACAIDKDFVMKPREIEVGTGLFVPTHFDTREIVKKQIINIPDYEQTNIEFAELIYDTILNKVKDMGEICRLELIPQPGYTYKLIIECVANPIKIQKEIKVPEGFGDNINEWECK